MYIHTKRHPPVGQLIHPKEQQEPSNEQAQLAMHMTVTLNQAAEKGREKTRKKKADKEAVVAGAAKA